VKLRPEGGGPTLGTRWPLCGRDEELRYIAAALARSDLRGVVLCGLAGVGKSRLAAEGLGLARELGHATASVVATATTANIPAGALAPLLPPECMLGAERFTLLARGCRALADAGGGRPLVLAIDDAHQLDPLSAELVHQAVTRSSVLLLATLRRGESAPDAMTSLWKDGLVERLEVTGLSRAETGELLAAVLDGPILGSTLQQLWDLTQGNVLFLHELVEGARQSGDLERCSGIWRLRSGLVPGARLTDLVEQRLGRLRPGEHRVVERVAFAEPIDVAVLGPITSPRDVQSLERRGLVDVAREDDRLRARLSHPLYSEVVRARTPALCARRIFAQLVEASDAAGATAQIDSLTLATWRLESGTQCSSDLLLDACGRAQALLDHPLAERLARAAIESGGGVEARRALGDCLYAQGRFDEADGHLRSLAGDARTDSDRARGAMSHAANLMWGLGREAEAEAVLAAAQRSVTDPDLRDEITSLRSRLVFAAGRFDETIATSRDVLGTAEDSSALAVLSAAAGLAPALALAGRTAESLAVLGDHLGLAFEHFTDEPHALGMLLVSQSVAHWLAGDLTAAATDAENLYGIGVTHGAEEAVCAGARSRGWAALARGRPRTAIGWIREALAAVPAGDVNDLACWCWALLAEAAAVAGDPHARDALCEAEAERRPAIRVHDAQLAVARAWVAVMDGNPAEAVEILVHGGREAAAGGAHGTELHILHAAVRLGYPEVVRQRLDDLARMVDGSWAPAFAAHAAALAERDATGLTQVARSYERIGAVLLAAEAEAEAAAAFRDQCLAPQARAAAARALALSASCEGASTPALFGIEAPVALTRREREIARLAAQGLSSPDIARRLVVSVRTVEGHLYRLFAKLGVSRREDLATHLRPGADHEPTGRAAAVVGGNAYPGTRDGQAAAFLPSSIDHDKRRSNAHE
jgi:DNA-binding CsgD family transcriptional regulator